MRIEGLGAMLPKLLASAVQKPAPVMPVAGDALPDHAMPANGDLAHPAIGSVQMLVAMSATSLPAERKRRATRTAQRGLDALDMLDKAMAMGRVHQAPFDILEHWADDREPTGDPALEALLDQIDLRVQVELAKLDRKL